MSLLLADEGSVYNPDAALLLKLEQAAETAMSERPEFRAQDAEISLSFVSEDAIRSLNASYRSIDEVTDVLSFPQFEAGRIDFCEPELLLGDIVICASRAQEQAEEYGHSFERELLYLFVHGLLHLLGYDHEDEECKSEMRSEEEHILSKIGVTSK